MVADKYNRAKVVDGWVVIDEEKPLYDEDSKSVLEKLKQRALDAAFLWDINM